MPISIVPENSAQGTTFRPNPLVQPVLERLTGDSSFRLKTNPVIIDLGCGKLRHLGIWMRFSKRIWLVDTRRQIERTQKFADKYCTMREYVDSLGCDQHNLSILTIEDFEKARVSAHIVFSVAVMDAVTKEARIRMIKAALRNLMPGGYLVVIAPRNDSSVLENCTPGNRFQDGFVIRRKGHTSQTFYANFRDVRPVMTLLREGGFDLVQDLSVFRQLCLIARKPCRVVDCPSRE